MTFNIMSPKKGIKKARFRPCHGYAMVKSNPSDVDPIAWSTVLSTELPKCKLFKMVQIRYNWCYLETSPGVYDFSGIQKHLDDLKLTQANGGTRKLGILIETKTFNTSFHVVPSWMRDAQNGFYGGGEFLYDGGSADGYMVRFDNVNVQARFDALAKAIGLRFKDEVQIEMISLPETSLPTPIGLLEIQIGGVVDAALFQTFTENSLRGLLVGLKALRKYMPYTIIRQMVNYPRKELTTSGFVVDAVAAGIALGAPDTFNTEPGYEINTPYNGLHWWLRLYKGAVPYGMEVQNLNYGFDNKELVVQPAKTWGASSSDITLVNNGGRIQLHSTAGAHGFSTTDFTNTLSAYKPAAVFIPPNIAGNGNFPSDYYSLYSIDNANDFTIVNRNAISAASWPVAGADVAIGALAWSDVAAHSLTSPFTAMYKAVNTPAAYPYVNQTYVPNNNGYLGYVPSKQQLFDFLTSQFEVNYIIWSRNTEYNTRSGRQNHLEVIDFLNTFAYKDSIYGGLNYKTPTSLL